MFFVSICLSSRQEKPELCFMHFCDRKKKHELNCHYVVPLIFFLLFLMYIKFLIVILDAKVSMLIDGYDSCNFVMEL